MQAASQEVQDKLDCLSKAVGPIAGWLTPSGIPWAKDRKSEEFFGCWRIRIRSKISLRQKL
jgi:hypothetical protein